MVVGVRGVVCVCVCSRVSVSLGVGVYVLKCVPWALLVPQHVSAYFCLRVCLRVSVYL